MKNLKLALAWVAAALLCSCSNYPIDEEGRLMIGDNEYLEINTTFDQAGFQQTLLQGALWEQTSAYYYKGRSGSDEAYESRKDDVLDWTPKVPNMYFYATDSVMSVEGDPSLGYILGRGTFRVQEDKHLSISMLYRGMVTVEKREMTVLGYSKDCFVVEGVADNMGNMGRYTYKVVK